MSEHTALDCNFLELVPLLYRDVELEVVLHAACDSEPHIRRGNITNCAGPAAIRLKVGQVISEVTREPSVGHVVVAEDYYNEKLVSCDCKLELTLSCNLLIS
jgi:hypothetical protein